MACELKCVPTETDPFIEKLKTMCKNPEKTFGDVAIGPKGVILPKAYMSQAQKILNMEVRKDDIWIISIPRSGTTWTEEMTWLISNDLNYEAAQSRTLYQRFRYLELAAMFSEKRIADDFSTVDDTMKLSSPRFIKTHLSIELLPQQLWTVKPKIIYVYRNPKDVVISQYHFTCMLNNFRGTLDDFAEAFLREKCNYSPYWSHVLDFWKMQNQQDVLFLSYENMKQNLLPVVHDAAKFLGKSLTHDQALRLVDHLDYKNMKKNASVNQEKQFLDFKLVSNAQDVNFIRKGVSGQWKNTMSSQLVEKFDRWSEQSIESTDFPYYE